METQTIGEVLVIILLLLWLLKCTVRVTEDHYKVVETWSSRYVRTISGVKGIKAATQEDVANNVQLQLGDFIDGEDSGKIDFIPWPYHRISTYEMQKIETVASSKITDKDKANVVWGDPANDSEVSVIKTSLSNHYRKQYTYDMLFDGLETGTPKVNRRKKTKEKTVAPQNVTMSVKLNVTVCSKNVFRTRYQEGDGGKWLRTLHGVIMSGLSELYAVRTFADISLLRSKKLDDVKLDDGKTFCGRVNEQMLDIKNLGQKTIDMDFLDYKVSAESQLYLKQLALNTNARLGKETAQLQADAQRELIKPKEEAAMRILQETNRLEIELKGKEDATTVKKFENLKDSNVRVYIEAADGSSSRDGGKPEVDKIITGVINLDIIKEINDEAAKGDDLNKKGGKK